MFLANNSSSLTDTVEGRVKFTLDSENSLETLEFMQDLIFEYEVVPEYTTPIQARNLFVNGELAMFLTNQGHAG